MPDAPSKPPAQPAHPTALCVAWSPVGSDVDQRLRGALKRPGLEVAFCDDPYTALACLAHGHGAGAPAKILLLIEPARLPHLADVLDLSPRYVPNLALWLFDPTQHPVLRSIKIGDALAAAGLVQPPTVVAPAPRPSPAPLQPAPQRDESRRAVSASGAVEWTGPWVSSNTQKWSEKGPAPSLRLSGEGTLPAQADVQSDDVDAFADSPEQSDGSTQTQTAAKPNPRVLSDEELAMLLGEPPPARQGRTP